MLTLILIDAQYSQKAIFGFEKGSIGKSHSSSGSHSPIKKPPSPPPPSTPYRYLENPLLRGNCYSKSSKFTLQLNQSYYCQQ